MVFQEIYASRHFQVDASSIILLRALSQMIRMKTCQSLSTRPSICQEISMPWHTVNSSTCFWLGAIKPPRLKRTSASPICVFPLCVFPLTPSADRWSNILFAHDFTGTIVISSFPGAGPQCESLEKKEQLILKMLSFLASTESDECFPKRV